MEMMFAAIAEMRLELLDRMRRQIQSQMLLPHRLTELEKAESMWEGHLTTWVPTNTWGA